MTGFRMSVFVARQRLHGLFDYLSRNFVDNLLNKLD